MLTAFGIYSLTIVLLFPGTYEEYISPFYSPPLGRPEWLPWFITAPMFVLWIPLGFRATCYYYRKAYNFVTRLNLRHPNWAWYSLFSLVATDLYLRLLQTGVITDFVIVPFGG